MLSASQYSPEPTERACARWPSVTTGCSAATMSLIDLGGFVVAVILEHRLEPFVVGAVDRDMAGPFLVPREVLVGLAAIRTP